jgi:hypothetical protein
MRPTEKKTTTESIELYKQSLEGNNYSVQSIKAYLGDLAQFGSWGATEQETGVSQRSPLQNSYFLRKKVAYGGMGMCLFAKISYKSQNLCDKFCKGMVATY